jgi:Flp pilus assembly protein TadB
MIDEIELKKEIESFVKHKSVNVESSDYQTFRNELLPVHFSFYEKACNFCGNLINIKADPKVHDKLVEDLDACHLATTPSGVTAFAIMFPIAFMITGIILSFLVTTFLMGGESTFFFIGVFVISGIALIMPLSGLPSLLANNWRLKASNQMVMSVFYIVSYMRHTSNLELAIKFTSDHITAPLSTDFKKLMWNVQSGKFSSMKDSVDNYLEGWKKYNMEFVEVMHLIESSLYESTEKKRLNTLEKSLSLVLESTYEKMLHFAQNLKSPITMLHMLGVILPILGLVILPLVVSFMDGIFWYHISIMYNVFLPAGVWYMGKSILSTRPTGYGQADITELNPELKKHTNVNLKLFGQEKIIDPKWVALLIIIIFFLIGNSPLIIHTVLDLQGKNWDLIFDEILDKGIISSTDNEKISMAKFSLLGYILNDNGVITGPYGLGSTLLSIMIPLGLAVGLGFYYQTKTKKLMKIRQKTKELENEFAGALFQLGNRVGDGLPAEIAFSKVSDIMENTPSGKFFDLVTNNIQALGMGVEDAIFHKKYGALTKFPSALIESSMKVFVESSKKGPDVASQALINISTYIKEMHRVDERLKDLMAEITSSMKSQINFLAPLISGIVIGLTSMITTILNTLGNQLSSFQNNPTGAATATTTGGGLLDLFGDSIPTFYFQIVVGVYVVQITFILTQMLNTIENGYDPLNEKFMLGQFVKKSGVMYSVIAFVIILLFNIIAGSVISNLKLS